MIVASPKKRATTRFMIAGLLASSSAVADAQATSGGVPGQPEGGVASATAQGQPASPDSTAATSAPEDAGRLSEIVVTATRRATNVQNVPLAITAVSGAALSSRGIASPSQLSGLAPGLNVDQGLGNGQTHVSIRGLASTDFSLGASSPIATYLDDVYQPYAYGIGTQIFDLDRIEVLRGPQGTLFGKNTTGGALLYYSQAPTSREEGYLSLDGGGGEFNHESVEGAFNKPLTDTLATRISFRTEHRGSYIDNLSNGSRFGQYTNYNGRLQFAWKPTSSTRINLKLFGLSSNGDAPSYIGKYDANPCVFGEPFTAYFRCSASGTPTPDSVDSRHTYSDVPIFENYHQYGATLKIDQDVSGFVVTSISNAQKTHYSVGTNDDGSGYDLFHSLLRSRTWQASEALRVATPVEKPLKAVVGLYGQYDKINAQQGSGSTTADPAFSYLIDGPGVQSTRTLAAFTNVTWDVTHRLSLIGGLRYSSEHKNIVDPLLVTGAAGDRVFTTDDVLYKNGITLYDPALGDLNVIYRDKHTWRRLTWDATANFKPTDQSLLYVKAASGFRSGGYVVGVTVPDTFQRLSPEIVRSYEFGFKTQWFDRHLRVNGAAFTSTYKDQQVQVANPNGPGLYVTNAGKSRIKGGELEVQAVPVRNLQITGSLGYTDAKYRQYETTVAGALVDYAGNTLPYAPKWTGNVAGSYTIPLATHDVILSSDWSVRSRIYFQPDQDPLTSDRRRTIGNVRLSYQSHGAGWSLSAYVQNVTNQEPSVFALQIARPDGAGPLLHDNIYAPTRTWGVQAGFRF